MSTALQELQLQEYPEGKPRGEGLSLSLVSQVTQRGWLYSAWKQLGVAGMFPQTIHSAFRQCTGRISMGLNASYMFCTAQNLGARGAQKLGLEKTLGCCSVHHNPKSASAMPAVLLTCFSNLSFETCPPMDFHHSFIH